MSKLAPPSVLVDVGNVVLPFDPMKPCAVLAKQVDLPPEEVLRRVYRSNLERAFEQGRIDGHQFTLGVSGVLGVELDYDSFHDLWVDMFTENPEVSAIVRELKSSHPMVLVSNTNIWHWRHVYEKFAIIREIPEHVLSCEEGVLKPHPAIYRAALEKVPRGGTTIFVDDIENNVEAARILGIKGIHFQKAAQLREDLKALGCRLN